MVPACGNLGTEYCTVHTEDTARKGRVYCVSVGVNIVN